MDGPQTIIDLKRLAAEVSVQHGIRVDPDDPMMAVVTLNRLVFEQAVGQVLERVQASVKRLRDRRGQGADSRWWRPRSRGTRLRFGHEAGGRESTRGVPQGVPNHHTEAGGGRQTQLAEKWLVVGLALAMAVFCLGFWMGVRLG